MLTEQISHVFFDVPMVDVEQAFVCRDIFDTLSLHRSGYASFTAKEFRKTHTKMSALEYFVNSFSVTACCFMKKETRAQVFS